MGIVSMRLDGLSDEALRILPSVSASTYESRLKSEEATYSPTPVHYPSLVTTSPPAHHRSFHSISHIKIPTIALTTNIPHLKLADIM